MQTYEEYLDTMKAYGFYPMSREVWRAWQLHFYGWYRE